MAIKGRAFPIHPWISKPPVTTPAALTPNGWFGDLSRAVVVPAVIVGGLAWLPSPPIAAANNTVTIDKWQPALSVAPRLTPAQVGFGSVPFNTVQPSSAFNYTNLGWLAPLSVPAPVAKAQVGFATVPFDKAQLSVNYTDFSWFAPLAGAPAVTKAQAGLSSVPFDTAQLAVNFTKFGWHRPLDTPVPVAQAKPGHSFVPFNTVQPSNSVTRLSWQQQPPNAVPLAKVWPGFSSVPFNTVQVNPNLVPLATYQQPLSVAAPVAKAQVGFGSVPFNTAQLSVNFTDFSWFAPLSSAVRPASAVTTQPTFVNVSVTVPQGWYQALSTAPLAAKVQFSSQSQPLFVGPADNNVTLDKWQSPLSVAPAITKVQPGFSFVPFDTAQASAAPIAGMAWFTPLATVPYTVSYAPQSFGFSPPQFGEIAPSPPVAGTTVGGAGVRYPKRKHLKKIWDEVLAEEAAERRTILAAQKFQRDQAAAAIREASDARTAKIRAKAQQAADERQLARLVADAESATQAAEARREAELQAALLAEIEAQEDEDEIMLLLSL